MSPSCFLTLSLAYASPLLSLNGAAALATPPQTPFTVSPVTTASDVLALADLRYAEWMSSDNNPPTLGAFRAATAEIHAERSERSTAFLARIGQTAVGAAELSSIEFENVGTRDALYVTDVVTSSRHRRMGVGNALMEAVEHTAVNRNARRLFLHVEEGNNAALGFYRRASLGYAVPSPNAVKGMDVEKLAENAGTVGQILLCKELGKKKRAAAVGGGGGFGRSQKRRSR